MIVEISAPSNNKTNNTEPFSSESVKFEHQVFCVLPNTFLTPATITVDTTTAQLVKPPVLHQNASRGLADIGVGLDVVQALLNNPLDTTSLWVYEAASTNQWTPFGLLNAYDWSQFTQLKVMQKYSYLYVYYSAVQPSIYPIADPSFQFITSGDSGIGIELASNINQFQDSVESAFAQYLPIHVSSAARKEENAAR